jgi:hypothetical protein
MTSSTERIARFIHVPARSRRVEGEFPLLINRRAERKGIVDLEEVAPTPLDSDYFKSDGGRKDSQRRRETGAKTSRVDNPYAEFAKGGKLRDSPDADLIKPFDSAQDIPQADIDKLKLKKFRWLPNPFLAEGDNRQGGPLYYAKYFRDRDRRLDDKVIREEVSKQQDSLARSGSVSLRKEGSVKSEKPKRKRAIWMNYRPLTESQVKAVDTVEKLVRILGNEIHLINEGSLDRARIISAIETRFGELITAPDFEVSKNSTLTIVKTIYHFGVYQEMDPVILSRALDIITGPSLRKLKPENLVYLLEALSRLRFRDQRALNVLDALALCWPLVLKGSPSMLVRGANAVARLDLASTSSSSISGLSSCLAEALPNLSSRNLEKVKAVTVTNPALFHDVMLLDFFVLAHRESIGYVRRVLLAFLKIRHSNPELVGKLPAATKEWLESMAAKESQRKRLQKEDIDEALFSSDLHKQIATLLGDECVVGTTCGPFTFDVFVPKHNAVIDACCEFQFYRRTAKYTTDARLRHDLIRSLGFKLIPISHFQWNSLRDDDERKLWLRKQISNA